MRQAMSAIKQINPLEEQGWDLLVADQPQHSFFHCLPWLRVLQNTYGYLPTCVIRQNAGSPACLMPLMEVESWLTGRRGVGLPFTDHCKPLCSDASSFQQLFVAIQQLGNARRWRYVEFRGGKEFFGSAPASVSFYGHELSLARDEKLMFSRFDGSVRRAIRKAETLGVVTEVSQSLAAVKDFYRLHCRTRKRHGLPPQPFSFFQNIHRFILANNLGNVVLARSDDTPIAAAVYFHCADRAIYKYGASDERFLTLRGNNLTMWEAIRRYSCLGVKRLDFGRTSLLNQGLRTFKLGWGCEEQSIDYFKYDLRSNRFVTERDETSGWHTRLFGKLPMPISRLIGLLLYKHCA